MSRTAALMLTVAGMTACATEEPIPGLDDLPPFANGADAGKGDDAACTDAAYRAFITSYVTDGAKATDNPCVSGNDASYAIWVYVAAQQLQPLFSRYEDAIDGRAQGTTTADAVVSAGTLDASTRAALAKLALVRPLHAGKVGYDYWLQHLYMPAVGVATEAVTPRFNIAAPQTLEDQWTREITSFEDEWLGLVEAAQPTVVEPGSFAIWWSLVGDTIITVQNDPPRVTSPSSPQASADLAWLARLAKDVPTSSFDADGVAFQQNITSDIGDAYTSASAPDLPYWTAVIAYKPVGGGKLSYTTWAQVFANVAQSYIDSPPTNAKYSELLTLLVSARPCALESDVDAIVTRFAAAFTGTDPSGHPLGADAVPTACP